jgi:O-antigen/teichoic acid export membrane protein
MSAMLRIAYVVYAGRVLHPAEYADFYTALALIFLFSTGLAPVAGSVTRFVSLHAANGEMDRVQALRGVMLRRVSWYALVVLAVGLIGAYPITAGLRFRSVAIPILAFVALAVSMPVELSRGVLRGVERFRAYSLGIVLESGIRLLLGVLLLFVLATAGMGLLAYVFAAGLMLFVTPQQLGPMAPETTHPKHAEDRRAVERLMGPLFVFAFAAAAFQNMDVLFVKRMFSPVEAGYYSAAASLAKSAGLVFAPFGVLLLPLLTAAYARGESLLPILLRTVARFTLLSGALVVAFAMGGDTIIRHLYGESYVAAGPLLPVLTAAMVLALLSVMIGQAFAAINRFAFLPLYLAGLAALAVALGLSDSIGTLVWVLFATQAATLLAMTVHFFVSAKRERVFHGRGTGS